ncbi:MAG TPA: tetratricopeptide repeat protein [Candidatus Acidoferrales bacterium]|nr:tetratricopeptide repeat protein [Candidatus Acidoferrales bacterium]
MTAAIPAPQSAPPAARVFRTADVARILGVPPVRVRAAVRAGLCRPAVRGRRLQFSFQDLVLLRAAQGLRQAAVPARRVRRALTELARQLPPGRPLSGVRIYADGRHVVVRDGRGAWRPDSGQVVFTFDVAELARKAGVVVPVRRARDRKRVSRASARQEAAACFERALGFEEEDDTDAACAAYRRAIELDPELGDAYINLGRMLHEQGDSAEAARLYHLALECTPDDPIAHYNLALALEDEHRNSAAIAHYNQAVDLDPDFADAHFNLARLLDRLGRRPQAMQHLLTYRRLTDEA